jgi:hypothetical protein
MWVDVKINADIFLKSNFELLFQVFYNLRDPTIIFIILLAVADEDVVIISFNYA